jgi:ABC-type nitrate/sulfonate/bicarbonate transport system substrate-binding protein
MNGARSMMNRAGSTSGTGSTNGAGTYRHGRTVRRVAGLAAAVAAATALAACSSGGSSTPNVNRSTSSAAAAAATASGAAASSAAGSPAKTTDVTLAMATYSGNYGPYLTAIDRGFYTAAGLKVKLVQANGATSIPGLISGSITFAAAAASAPPAILKGYKIKIVSVNVDSPPYMILADKSITSLKGLAGKSLGVQSKGDSTQIVADEYLAKEGVARGSVTDIALGGTSARVAALTSGAIPAIVANPQDLQQLQEEGKAANYRVLGSVQGVIQFPVAGTVVSDSLLSSNPALVKAFLSATAQGEEYFLTHESYSVALLSKEAQESTAAATADFQDTGTWPTCACLPTTTQTAVISAYANANQAQPVPTTDAYSFSLANSIYPSVITGSVGGNVIKNTLPKTSALTAGS